MKTIKQRISYAVMGLMAMGFTACTQNEDMAPTLKGQEINATFSVGGMQTRVNTLGHGNNWENEDLISVLQIFGDEDTRTGEYKYVEENGLYRWEPIRRLRWEKVGRCELIAWYPYDITNPSIYNLHIDQSDETKLKAADLINGYWYDVPKDYVDIPMKHRMSLVTIFYEIGEYDHPNKDISNLQICSPCNGASFSRLNNDWIMDTSNNKEPTLVYACQTGDDGGKSFSAIIVPGSLDTSADFLKFTLDGHDYTVKLKQKTDFLEGHRYIYSLKKIGRDKVELAVRNQGVLPGWENEEEL